MITWVFNFLLFSFYLSGQNGNVQNQQNYDAMVAGGATEYSCVDLSTHRISTACSQPAPKNVY